MIVNFSLLLGSFFLGMIASYVGVGRLIRWTRRNEIIDIPNERSSHVSPTPRGGGLLIVLTALVAWTCFQLVTDNVLSYLSSFAYVAGSALIAFVSWQDDLRSLPFFLRFAVHCVAALLVVLAIGYSQSIALPMIGTIHLGFWGAALTLFWLVGLTNAYNFMDGIDGLAGGQAVIASLAWALLAWQIGQPVAMSLGVFLAAASLGFLVHNWPPASIFMGDVGSAFLGYTFAVLPFLVLPADQKLPLIAILFVWPFIFDTTFTLLRRLRNGENIFTAHRTHLYQRLVICGYSHRSVALLYMGLAAITSIMGFWWFLSDGTSDYLLVVFLVLQSYSLWRFVVYQEHKLATPQLNHSTHTVDT